MKCSWSILWIGGRRCQQGQWRRAASALVLAICLMAACSCKEKAATPKDMPAGPSLWGDGLPIPGALSMNRQRKNMGKWCRQLQRPVKQLSAKEQTLSVIPDWVGLRWSIQSETVIGMFATHAIPVMLGCSAKSNTEDLTIRRRFAPKNRAVPKQPWTGTVYFKRGGGGLNRILMHTSLPRSNKPQVNAVIAELSKRYGVATLGHGASFSSVATMYTWKANTTKIKLNVSEGIGDNRTTNLWLGYVRLR